MKAIIEILGILLKLNVEPLLNLYKIDNLLKHSQILKEVMVNPVSLYRKE